MSEIKEEGAPVTGGTVPPVEDKPNDDVQAKISEAIAEVSRGLKTQIDGLNRRNSELEKQVRDKELATLSEKERAAKEIELARIERDKILAEAEQLKRDRVAERVVIDKGLSPDFAKFINARDEDGIKAEVDLFVKRIEDEVQTRYKSEVAKRFAGKEPASGATPQGNTLTEADFLKLSARDQAAFMGKGGSIRG
jgi:hypothetical protein